MAAAQPTGQVHVLQPGSRERGHPLMEMPLALDHEPRLTVEAKDGLPAPKHRHGELQRQRLEPVRMTLGVTRPEPALLVHTMLQRLVG